MKTVVLTAKNYRPFADAAPLQFEIGRGLTAFVGPNNSGKSSALKLLYELRALLGAIGKPQALDALLSEGGVGYSTAGVEDPAELFCTENSRPLTLQLEFPWATGHQIRTLTLTCSREQPGRWVGKAGLSELSLPITEVRSNGIDLLVSGAFGRFEADLAPLAEIGSAFSDTLYVGPYRNAISEGAGTYYDIPIGTNFIQQWNDWKTGSSRSANRSAQAIVDELARIFCYERLEINESDGQKGLQVIVDGRPFKLRELGAGLAQFLIVMALVEIRKPSLLLIDEPELNLHPALQVDFLMSLAARATEGVLFCTHSIGLARTTAEKIYSFRRDGATSRVRPFESETNLAEFLGEMSFSAVRDLGFSTVLLVEGVTEVKTIQQFLRRLGLEHKVVLVPLGGNALINSRSGAELNELARLADRVAVLIDSERSAEDEPIEVERQAFLDDCAALKFRVHATRLKAMENYLTDEAVKGAFGPTSVALGPFERLRDSPNAWRKRDNWRAARLMTRDDVMSTDFGPFLAALA